MRGEHDFNKALNYSFLLLKYRARTRKEIINRLKLKKFPTPVIEKVIESLDDYGYINDANFTSAFIREKINKGLSKRKIYFDLKRLGVSEEIIKEGISCINNDDYTKAIRKLVIKKSKQYSGLDNKNYRLFRYLAQRGFSVDEIREVLNENR
ncbi:MAG: hypothetical protein B1H08_01235 [Candidatus Omnitrophica bacterium 4484_171]|nr:MAG: hypothetical protein B1H08_01235 [Candidatus Omnitrophica bacterium 4484_171]